MALKFSFSICRGDVRDDLCSLWGTDQNRHGQTGAQGTNRIGHVWDTHRTCVHIILCTMNGHILLSSEHFEGDYQVPSDINLDLHQYGMLLIYM